MSKPPQKTTTLKRTYKRRPRQRRVVAAGVLAPHQEYVVELPPHSSKEQVLGLTPLAGDITVRPHTPQSVVVVNLTSRIVAYTVLLVPSIYIRAATMPWKQVLHDVGAATKASGIFTQLRDLLRK